MTLTQAETIIAAAPAAHGKDVLTATRLATWRTCPRRHWFRYELALVPDRDSQPLRMGAVIHQGLDLMRQGDADWLAKAVTNYDELPAWVSDDEQMEDWAVEREIVARLLAGYAWRWSTDDAVTVASEIKFELPIKNPDTGASTSSFTIAGKIDAIISRGGRLLIRETKTTGESLAPDSDYWLRLRMDQQLSTYYWAAPHVGYDVAAVEYDCLRKPMIRPRKLTKAEVKQASQSDNYCGEPITVPPKDGRESVPMFGARFTQLISERPDDFYVRKEVPRLFADIREFETELWQQQQTLRLMQARERWWRNTAACLHPYRCPYLKICPGFSPATVPAGFRRCHNLHPELED